VLFPGSQIGLNPDEITLAEVVKQQGYATICIGKWHLGHREPFLPTKQGFDSYFGIPYSNDMTIDTQHAKFAMDCVFREGMTEEKARAEAIRHTVPLMRGEEVVEYPADQATLTKRYTEEAIKFIRDHKSDPFFIYLPHTMVHIPLAASEGFRDKSGNGLIGDAIEELDWSVGQIMQTLADLQLDDKTLVIFTSDNGAAVGSSLPWRGKKASNYEGGVREPCMIHDLDLLLDLVGAEVVSVEAVGVNVLTPRLDIANARLRFASGCIANLTASRISRDRVRKARFFAGEAYVGVDFAAQEAEVYRLDRSGPAPRVVGGSVPIESAEPLGRELEDFVAAVRGRRAAAVPGAAGRDALALATRIADQIAMTVQA
jgi:hypothetical protein